VIVTCDTTRSKMLAPCDIRRPHLRRRHSGPPRAQRASHRTHRREPAPRPRQTIQNCLTCDPARGRNSLGQQARHPGRDHLVTGGRHHPGIPGRNHPVTDGRLHRNRQSDAQPRPSRSLQRPIRPSAHRSNDLRPDLAAGLTNFDVVAGQVARDSGFRRNGGRHLRRNSVPHSVGIHLAVIMQM
jgi:hypothetical protein